MAIQNRRGSYSDFRPSKGVPGEFLVVQQGDPSTTDGKAVYITFASGDVKRLATSDEITGYNNQASEYADDAIAAKQAAEAALSEIRTLEGNATQAASDASASATQAASVVNNALADINAAKTSAVESVTTQISEMKADAISDIEAKVSAASSSASQGVSDIEFAYQTFLTAMNGKTSSATAEIENIKNTAGTNINQTKDSAISELNTFKQDTMDEITAKGQQISRIATNADQVAADAVNTANNCENHMASLDSKVNQIEAALSDVSIDPDDLGLYQDPDTYYVYPTYKNVRSENGIPLSGAGGGGGGGDVISAVLTVENTSGWLSKTIATGASCPVSFVWSSIEDDMPTGDGAMRITVNEIVRSTMQIKQGNISVDLAPYLSAGTNKVKVRISDTYDQGKTITFNITSITLSISSTFDTSTPYSSIINFPYTPIGAVEKTIHFIVDGTEIGTQVTSVSGRQMNYTIPAQAHGGHSLRVYFTALLNGETVRSNELYYEFISVDPLNDTPIITSSMSKTTFPQYSNVPIVFQVYDPKSLTAEAKIYANDTLISTQTVGREEQSYAYKANNYGTIKIDIKSGTVTKTFDLNITESEVDVEAETENLVLYMTSHGRSNNEEHPEIWEDSNRHISATLTGFNWTSDGWQSGTDGATCLRVSGDARVSIPFNMFANDIRQTGYTVEVEFATRNVADYNAVVMSCFSGGRGLKITPQSVTLKSDGIELSMQYKEGEHIRVAYTVEKRSENRLVKGFIEGTIARAVQYPVDDDFVQVTPVGISIGSDDCTIDIYCIRVYTNDLTMQQVLNNWIADTQDGSLMLERYTRNNIYDAYGKIVISQLPAYLPYFILDAEELPQYKGDKKTISGQYVDPMYPSKSFTFTGMQINVQGTSSAPYYRKNFDMQFKGGFEMASGHADKYKLKDNSIPTNRFVTKADVASSEAVNNTQGVQIYNDLCPYKTDEMKADPRVRWGIDGFPIVIFWHNTLTDETTFYGKANFNFPKRFPDGYGYTGDDESWEFQNNTSNLMLFLTDFFDESLYTDPETGETKERWRYDYEARFPDDTWIDYSKLQIFQSFVFSTYRGGATGDLLDEPVTYEGTRTEYERVVDPVTGAISYEEKIYRTDITYTNDTADYRLAKFRAEFGNYAELDSFIFYYVFTEFFLMVDSRAKNLFIGFHGSECSIEGINRKAVAEPYDMDTQMGIDNEGVLRMSPYLEDTDTISGANVFNGQTSVLWNNLRDAFPKEIQQMYQNIRSGGLRYADVETRFDNAQAKWPEAIWDEDAQSKYFDPLVNPDPGKEPTDFYLPMSQGTKQQQRRSWLTNRFAYMDSKWNAGDASLERIQLRGYAKSDITVTPYINLYPTVKYGSYVVSARANAGVPTLLACPIDTLNDTEIYIYSARNVASVGDLSGLKVGIADFSYATNIQEVKLGDADANYDNPNMKSINFGNNKLLKKIDCRNCSGLGTGERTAFDLSGCEIIEEIYFEGTQITGLTLPNGGVLRKLHLPATVSNLTILNQKNITDLTIPSYANITTLRLENVPTLDTKTILNAIPANTRVRLIGFYWTATDATEIEALLDKLDTMRGLDEAGNNMETAQVSGTIHTDSLTGAQIAAYNARYPYLKVTADYVESYLTFKSYDLETTIKTVQCLNGVPQESAPTVPTRPNSSDGHYSYTALGWNTAQDSQTVDPDALVDVIADRTVYPAYQWNVQTYTVTWVNNGTTVETDSNVPWGTIPHYDGSTPTKDGQTSTGWSPDPTQPITGNTTFTAQYLPVYAVTFKNDTGSTTLDTQNVVQGQNATYGGATPTSSEDASLAWLGWATSANSHTADAVLTNVQSSMTVYAAFASAVEVVEIEDDWATILSGTKEYKLGNYKPIDLGGEGVINMQIVGINADTKASGGFAKYSWLGMTLLNTAKVMNSAQKTVDDETAYTAGGWEYSDMRSYLKNTIKPLIPEIVRNAIVPVTKIQSIHTGDAKVIDGQTTTDDVWIPSNHEIFSTVTTFETQGANYGIVFKTNTDRVKTRNGSASRWWLRSAYNARNFRGVNSSGGSNYNDADYTDGVALGFCT